MGLFGALGLCMLGKSTHTLNPKSPNRKPSWPSPKSRQVGVPAICQRLLLHNLSPEAIPQSNLHQGLNYLGFIEGGRTIAQV